MQWFAGNVETAIQISRKNHALLIVYITNETEEGRLFDGFWEKIDAGILSCPVVALKMKAGEDAALQFADVYPVPIVPAVYMFTENRELLEVITPIVGRGYDDFRGKFNRAIEEFLKKSAPIAPESPEVAQIASTPSEPTPAPTAPQNDPQLAEKVARARELLKIKKQKEEEQRREAEKHQKAELMKAQKSRQEHEDKALMEAAKQRKKEKLEADKEKQRILAQIKADREDRLKRNSSAAAPNAEKKTPETASAPVLSDRCRLQVRLPDGSTFIEDFPSNDVLNSLIEIIRQKPGINGAFEVSQTYPRRVFTQEDYGKTFVENKLTPTSVLVVLQKRSPPSAVVTASSSIFSLLFSPFLFVWNIFSGWFTGMAATGSAAKKAQKTKNSGNSAGPQNPGAARARGMPRVAEVRRRGNVAGLENPNDDDPEERASFNGNSTQFM